MTLDQHRAAPSTIGRGPAGGVAHPPCRDHADGAIPIARHRGGSGRRRLLVPTIAGLLATLLASACVPTTAPNWRWHTCKVPVTGLISPSVAGALSEMTALTGITFQPADKVTATYHGISFEKGDLPGSSTAYTAPVTQSVGGRTVIDRALIVWDVSSNPPSAAIARHELGHAMGLAHSGSAVMSSSPRSSIWTAAERSQLAAVGRASGCRS